MITARFPRMVTETLSGRPLVLPDGLDDDLAFVVLVFRRHAQAVVDSWMKPLARMTREMDGVRLYELPMLAGGWRMVSGFIDGGMRAGIPVDHHDSVATYYGDTNRFRECLGIHDLDSAYPFLVDSEGTILWRGSGWAGDDALNEIDALLTERVS